MPMLEQLHSVLVLAALIGSGLITGVFFAFSTFVMRALARLKPEEGIKAMQSINLTVLNPWFLGVFMGTALICLMLFVWTLTQLGQTESRYLIAGSLFYLIGCFMVTGLFNVPRNEVLAKVDAIAIESESLWNNYVDEWTIWNHVRTTASLLAVVCFAIGFR